ncbi:hypothetical protein D6Y19_24690 [Vibrio parahaemolyticus]|nr:hypothetical protein [Vibrio parahaemolyticus]
MVRLITKRLRRIHNAWHFRFNSNLVFTAQWFRLGDRVVHHLTRRYMHGRVQCPKGLKIEKSKCVLLYFENHCLL